MRGLEWYKNLYQKFDRKTDYAKAVVNLHNKRVLLAPDPVSKSTLLLCTFNKNLYVFKYYLQFSINAYAHPSAGTVFQFLLYQVHTYTVR